MTDYEDRLEMLMEERIDQVLNECRRGKRNYAKKEEEYLTQLENPVREKVEKLLVDLLQSYYEECRAVYCAGIEDGIRIARKIFTI